MSDTKDSTSFFRKVVKFVANPTTDWADLDAPIQDARDSEYAKSELKAMIERKRRNDFVRKREFDMLRKMRREGLSSEQLAALGGSSHVDDSDVRAVETGVRVDGGVKAKIDEIEQQMVGESYTVPGSRPASFYEASTLPASLVPGDGTTVPASLDFDDTQEPPRTAAPAVMGSGVPPLAPLAPLALDGTPIGLSGSFGVEVSEVAHDPELDETVIAFANADFDTCERALAALTGRDGSRAHHAETWLALFDLYRATGQQQKFDGLALEYAQQFGWSAPQWQSMPQLVAQAAADEQPPAAHAEEEPQAGWVCPAGLDSEAVGQLHARTLQMPLPWVLDWQGLMALDTEACAKLSELFRGWLAQPLEMRWLGGDHLLQVLRDATPTGVRDVDPAIWKLRLDTLRLANRPGAFDEAAIDYCVTYEVSPPSWERGPCRVRISGAHPSVPPSTLPPSSVASTSFLESQITGEGGTFQVANVNLSGQLAGDIGELLKKLDTELGTAAIVNVNCSRLIRVDFIAAGDLLNWVLARRGENRSVNFVEAHRLVALFFGAMGISEHAKVKVRTT